MNRRERRAAAKRGDGLAAPAFARSQPGSVGLAQLMAEARRHFQDGRLARAQDICHQIRAREPSHVDCLNLLGVIAQSADRQNVAIKMFAKAIAADEFNPACHYNIASSYQALGQRDEAASHFRAAIALGMSEKHIEGFILENPAVVAYLTQIGESWPQPAAASRVAALPDLAAIAHDLFLRCALESVALFGAALEVFLTHLRAALLRIAAASLAESRNVKDDIAELLCTLAIQCFINEFVFTQSEEETREVGALRDALIQNLAARRETPTMLLAAVAAYWPLHSLPNAELLLEMEWPASAAGLVRQQVREPLEEARDRNLISALTTVEDTVSLQVMQQYEENPYPRWTRSRRALIAASRQDIVQSDVREILIAGCGTGRHTLETAILFPAAQVLAIDVSRASLAYARRKTREEGLHNIEYAQADILKLEEIARKFDRIVSVGVLHHLDDPWAGWRVLLSLLKPDGVMRIGLYSETARQPVVAARALIAERGYRATAEDIRRFRQDLLHEKGERLMFLGAAVDFYCMSGCRDLLFNVMEHRVTIPQIKAFLDRHALGFLGFELAPMQIEAFQQQFPGAALTDLDCWHAFEAANPDAFLNMYVFSVRRRAPA